MSQPSEHPESSEPMDGVGDNSETASTYSTFSLSSTINDRIFREDSGRIYQAKNDDYALPLDAQEQIRLDAQHYGIKASQHGKNYLPPLGNALPNQGEGKTVLDVGCASGTWIIEMAQEFPKAEFTGCDLAPVWRDVDLPNLRFCQEDISDGLPFPDNSFDVIHGRALIAGIRDWRVVIREVERLLKPGGVFASVDVPFPWPLIDVPVEDQWKVAPGFMKFLDYLTTGLETRGYDVQAPNVSIPQLLHQGAFRDIEHFQTYTPLWPWAQELHLKQAGEYMLADAREIPETVRMLIIDSCDISESHYNTLKKGWENDLFRPGAHSAIPVVHNYAVRN